MRSVTLTMLLLIAGCASQPYVHELAADHPANPAAETMPLPQASTVLNATGDAAAPAPAAADHSGHAGHSAHPAPAASHSAPTTTQAAAVYVCPMHPEVKSNDPKARCPICGMFLKPPKGAAK